ncbi:hypothetical protein GCM10010466_24040 [Planomonospora alba]|uniref:Uncharacterized protein n=1 Tax=Planomonospora alba TaxID=161354 RepID=A0ABP6N1B5_9ACTN
MGTRPTRHRAVRLAAGALLAVHTTTLFSPATGAAPAAGAPPAATPAGNAAPAAGAPPAAPASDAPPAARVPLAAVARRMPADPRSEGRTTLRRERPVWLTHTQAIRRLGRAGLGLYSSGGCSDRANRRCTSLEAIRTETLRGVIRLKRRSGCPVILTGGTETGHTPGRYSHANGYKLDVEPNACLDRYIRRTEPFRGLRSDGALLYGTAQALYARTPSHWDIVFV